MDPNKRETDQIFMEMLYQAGIADYIKIIVWFNKNIHKSYTVIWNFCNKQIQNSIDMNVEYETKIQDNPIKLLNYIKILIHKPERLKYLFVSITEAFKRVVNMMHKDNEKLLGYSKFLKQTKDILEARFGKDILVYCVDNLKEFKNTIGA